MIRIVIFTGILMLIVAGCDQNAPSSLPIDDLPENGDVARGEALFSEQVDLAPACSVCHNEAANAAPDLAGYSEVADTRVEGESALEYTFYSITEPGRYIVDGYGNAMYNQYDGTYTPQQIADLIAYLLSL